MHQWLGDNSSGIATVEIARCDMPFKEGEWHFALGSMSSKPGWLVRIRDDDGMEGLGFAGEGRFDGESMEILHGAFRSLASGLDGRRPEEVHAIVNGWDRGLYANRRAKAGLELALWDLTGKRAEVPAHTLLGSQQTDAAVEVEVVRIVPLDTPDEMAAYAAGLVDDGYRYLKVKAQGGSDLDVRRLQAIRDRLGDAPNLVVDANQSMKPKAAVAYCHAVEDLRVDVFEQPVHRDDIEGLRFVRERVQPLVEADEGVASIGQAIELIRRGAVDGITIKIAKMGGLMRSLQIADLCQAAGVGHRVGASFGSCLYAAAAMQFLAVATTTYPSELGEAEHLRDDPVTGVGVVNGRMRLPDGPGLGIHGADTDALTWERLV